MTKQSKFAISALSGLVTIVVLGSMLGNNDRYITETVTELPSYCPSIIDETAFASAEELKRLLTEMNGFGLRTTGSDAHNKTIDWIEQQLADLPDISLESDPYPIYRWQPSPQSVEGPGRDLERAAVLEVGAASAGLTVLPVAGAVPYSLPSEGVTADLVYLPDGEAINPQQVKGKILLRDLPERSIPNFGFLAMSRHLTDGFGLSYWFKPYVRPYLATSNLVAKELEAAAEAGAVGMIFAFNVTRDNVAGYFDPHHGTHFALPAAWVGVDEAIKLKALARSGGRARLSVLAETDQASTRNLFASLPGQSSQRIILITNSDGNTWVQENGNVGLVALARYFASLPVECRPRTLEFAFTSAHLHMSKEGSQRYSKKVSQDFADGEVAYVFALEHLGTREILPKSRDGKPGFDLEFSGQAEMTAWFVGESNPLIQASIKAVERHELPRIAVLEGGDPPDYFRSPRHCSFGGIASHYHRELVPSINIISGPWSLWAPSFGEAAIDIQRMRKQLLAAADVVLDTHNLSADVLAGDYSSERDDLTAETRRCDNETYDEISPHLSSSIGKTSIQSVDTTL